MDIVFINETDYYFSAMMSDRSDENLLWDALNIQRKGRSVKKTRPQDREVSSLFIQVPVRHKAWEVKSRSFHEFFVSERE
jgi:hypothetical protein